MSYQVRCDAMLFTAMVLIGMCGASSQAQGEEGKKHIICTIDVAPSEILPFEPVSVLIKLTNEAQGQTNIKIFPSGWASIGVKEGEQIHWLETFSVGTTERPPAPQEYKLDPKQGVTFSLSLQDDAIQSRAVLAKPGEIYVKGMVNAFEKVGDAATMRPIESEPARVVVLLPKGKDEQAFVYLKEKGVAVNPRVCRGIHQFFSWQGAVRSFHGPELIQEVDRFAAAYPESKYAAYAKLGAAMMWRHGPMGKADLTEAARRFKEIAEDPKNCLVAYACYHLCEISLSQDDVEGAQEYSKRLRSVTTDSYLKYLADFVGPRVENQFRLKKGR